MSAGPSIARTEAERGCLKSLWPGEFSDGERCAFLRKFKGERERGGFPLGLPPPSINGTRTHGR